MDALFPRILIGVPAPETPEETEDNLRTVDGMRRAIEKASYESPLIAKVLNSARRRGLKGEDTYAYLAYYALRYLEDAHQRESHYLTRAPFIRPPKEDVSRG